MSTGDAGFGPLARARAYRWQNTENPPPKIAGQKGRVFKSTGDGVLAEFPSVVNAVACAAEIQTALLTQNAALTMRIGVNVGDVIVEHGDLFGEGVNIAARLEGLAPVSGILISGSARDQLGNALDFQFDDIGEQTLKNIEHPVRAYLVRIGVGEGRSVRGTVAEDGVMAPCKPELLAKAR